MSARVKLLCALFVCVFAATANVAHAGPVEQFVQLALNPKAPDVMLLRYEYGGDGIFYTHDGGKTWTLTCAAALDSALIGGLTAGVAGDGTAMFSGELGGSNFSKTLWEGDESGCAFARIGSLADVWISDVQPDPTDDGMLFGVSSGLDNDRRNGLWARKADGVWSAVGPRERVMISRLRIAATDKGTRMYTSALREVPVDNPDAGAAKFEYPFVIRVSDDGGETWDEHVFPIDEKGSLRLEAVDPRNPDTILVSLGVKDAQGVPWEDTTDKLFVSEDRGATFREYMTVSEIGGVVFDAEDRLWIGDAGSVFNRDAPQGLWTAASLSEAPTKVSDDVTQCLAFQPATDTLYACQRQSLGSVNREHDGKVTPVLRAVTAAAISSCAGTDVVAACEMQLCGAYCGAGHFAQAPLCKAYDTPTCGPSVAAIDSSPDGGTTATTGRNDGGAGATTADAAAGRGAVDAGTDASDVQLTGTGTDCGCAVVGQRRAYGAGLGYAWLFAALLVAVRRATRRRY